MREINFSDAHLNLDDGTFVFNDCINENDDVKFDSSFTVLNDITSKGQIKANYSLVSFGSVTAERITVENDLICFKNIECDELNIYGELKCFGNISAKKINVRSLSTINGGCLGEGSFGNNLTINGCVEIANNVEVNGDVICSEGIIGAGRISCKYIYASDYLEIDVLSEVNKDNKVKEKNHSKDEIATSSILKSIEEAEDLNQFVKSAGYLEFIKNTTVAIKRIESEVELLNEEYLLGEVVSIFSKLSLIHKKFEKDYKTLKFVEQIQDKSIIEDLNVFLKLVDLKMNLSKYLLKIDACNYLFNECLEKQRINLKAMKLENIRNNKEFSILLNLIEKTKKYFTEEEYYVLIEKAYRKIGITLKLVSKKIDIQYTE